jgi:hypothetical protein
MLHGHDITHISLEIGRRKKKDDKIKSQENEKYELNQEHVKLCMLDK